ncbi:hypothetical protein [Pseudochelatococcus sp. G4_1912]|uniref:hypothetical protein n=1 Tax=Pseudochelatococcus sp. G4_1912 TaxID=3114288 RepID=UPI0039C68F0C
MPLYEVKKTGWLAGTYRHAGGKVELTEDKAKYFLPPHDDRLAFVLPVVPQMPKGKASKPALKKG